MSPLVSVVLREREGNIEKAIQSVRGQTYKNVELIVVERCSGLAPHAAWNSGMRKAQGQFIATLNSNETFYPTRIERLLEFSKRTRAELAFGFVDFVDRAGKKLDCRQREVFDYNVALSLRHGLPTIGFNLLRYNLAMSSGNLFFSRALYQKLRFRAYPYRPEVDFLLRALRITEPKLLAEPLMALPLDRISRETKKNIAKESRDILQEYLKSRGKLTNTLAPCAKNWPNYFSEFLQSGQIDQ